MTPELTVLALACVLTFAQAILPAVGGVGQVGLSRLAGNRDDVGPLSGWYGRAQRAHRNMLENLVLFAALVLTAEVSGRTSDMTELGAQIFLWSRIAYAIIYVVGVPWVRTIAWLASIAGLALILLELF
jgi:uncharacterized MAPEG superfamily protein